MSLSTQSFAFFFLVEEVLLTFYVMQEKLMKLDELPQLLLV